MSSLSFAYHDLSIDDLMNEDLWTLDDSQNFLAGFTYNGDDWEEDEEEDSFTDLEDNNEVVTEDEEPVNDDDPFDWFHERSPIYDV